MRFKRIKEKINLVVFSLGFPLWDFKGPNSRVQSIGLPSVRGAERHNFMNSVFFSLTLNHEKNKRAPYAMPDSKIFRNFLN